MKNRKYFAASFHFLAFLVQKYGWIYALLSKDELVEFQLELTSFVQNDLSESPKEFTRFDVFIRKLAMAYFRFAYMTGNFDFPQNCNEEKSHVSAHYLLVHMLVDLQDAKRINLISELRFFQENLDFVAIEDIYPVEIFSEYFIFLKEEISRFGTQQISRAVYHVKHAPA